MERSSNEAMEHSLPKLPKLKARPAGVSAARACPRFGCLGLYYTSSCHPYSRACRQASICSRIASSPRRFLPAGAPVASGAGICSLAK